MSQLPWLLLTLPAGVITDRFDRKKIIVATDIARGVVTTLATLVLILHRRDFTHVKSPLGAYHGGSQSLILATMMIASFILGSAEVLGNNSSQTFMPEVLVEEHLARGNGQMWSAEYLTNSFIGPALGSLLIGVAVYLPFLVDAGSFFGSAGLIALITVQAREIIKKKDPSQGSRAAFMSEFKEGFSWLMSHEILRPMAFTLGVLNLYAQISFAAYILFAQEVLHVSVFTFAILGTAGAAGGVIAGLVAPKIVKRLGDGPALTVALLGMPTIAAASFFAQKWYYFYILIFLETFCSVLWNIVTVTFRQTVIPTEILGRVNSGYRFFGWGSMPIGSLLGGLLVSILTHFTSRNFALRAPFMVAAVIGVVTWVVVRRTFTSAKLMQARQRQP